MSHREVWEIRPQWYQLMGEFKNFTSQRSNIPYTTHICCVLHVNQDSSEFTLS